MVGRKKLSDRNIRKLTRSGNSRVVSIPIEMLADLGWREKQKLKVTRVRGGVKIVDWKK